MLLAFLSSGLAAELKLTPSAQSGPRVLVVDVESESMNEDSQLEVWYRTIRPNMTAAGLARPLDYRTCQELSTAWEEVKLSGASAERREAARAWDTCDRALIGWSGESWSIYLPQPPSAGTRYLIWVRHVQALTEEDSEVIEEALTSLTEGTLEAVTQARSFTQVANGWAVETDTSRLVSAIEGLAAYQTADGEPASEWVLEDLGLDIEDGKLVVPHTYYPDTSHLLWTGSEERFEQARAAALESHEVCAGGTLQTLSLSPQPGDRERALVALSECSKAFPANNGVTAWAAVDEFKRGKLSLDDLDSALAGPVDSADAIAARALTAWFGATAADRARADLEARISGLTDQIVSTLTISETGATESGARRLFDLSSGLVYAFDTGDVLVPYQASLCPFGCVRDKRAWWWSRSDFASSWAIDLGSAQSVYGNQDERYDTRTTILTGISFAALPLVRVAGGAFFYEHQQDEKWARDWYLGATLDVAQAIEIAKPFGIELPAGVEVPDAPPLTAEPAASTTGESSSQTE